jgi:hypothetical protein
MVDFIWRSVVIGAIAVAFMDVWALILRAVIGKPLSNWGLVGRWFLHLPRGVVFHDDIARAESFSNETAVGWIAHYVIGFIYAGALLLLAGPGWSAAPTFLPPLIVGLVTVGAGWFLLQPGMGAGWASSKRPDAMQARMFNIVGHIVFAIGLYAGGLLLARLG